MNKKSKFLALWLVILLLIPGISQAMSVKEEFQQPVAPGAIHRQYRAKNSRVNVIEVDLNNPNVDLEVLTAGGGYTTRGTVSEMAKAPDTFAAINGDFFNMNKQGAPFGPTVIDGKIQGSPLLSIGLYGIGVDANRTAYVENFTFSGTVKSANGATYPLAGLNKTEYVINHTAVPSHKNALHLYNDFWRSKNRGASKATEVLLNGNYVVEQIGNGKLNMAVPQGKYILQATGTGADFIKKNVKVGQKLNINYKIYPDKNWKFLIGGHALLLDQGNLVPYTMDADAIGGRRPRSAAGISANGKKVYLASVEGGTNRSQGMTLTEWAQALKAIGIYKAVNLDGGGSTTMVARKNGDFTNTVITAPEKNGAQRSIVNSIGVKNKAPKLALSHIAVGGPSTVYKGEVVPFTLAKGWDDNFHPKDVSQIPYTVSDFIIGESAWVGNRFISNQQGETTVVVSTPEGLSATKVVKILPPPTLKALNLIAADTSEAGLGIKAEATTKEGRKYVIDPGQMEWTVIGANIQMDHGAWKAAGGEPIGRFTFLERTGPFTEITGKYGPNEAQVLMDNPGYKKLRMSIGSKDYNIDGAPYQMDTAPYAVNNRTLVPLRFIVEGYGGEVGWNQEAQTAIVKYKGREISLPLNQNRAIVDGREIPLDVPATAKDNRTFVPIRFVMEQFGLDVNYVPKGKFVDIYEKM